MTDDERREQNYEWQRRIISEAKEAGVPPLYLAAEIIRVLADLMPTLRETEQSGNGPIRPLI